MPELRMRPKNQMTLPASIVREVNIKPDDRLTVVVMNGSIVITPKPQVSSHDQLMQFAGIGRGFWGNTPDEVNATIRNLKDSWTR